MRCSYSEKTSGLLFNAVAFGATLVYFLLSGRDFEKVRNHVAEYFALIFFISCGISRYFIQFTIDAFPGY